MLSLRVLGPVVLNLILQKLPVVLLLHPPLRVLLLDLLFVILIKLVSEVFLLCLDRDLESVRCRHIMASSMLFI